MTECVSWFKIASFCFCLGKPNVTGNEKPILCNHPKQDSLTGSKSRPHPKCVHVLYIVALKSLL